MAALALTAPQALLDPPGAPASLERPLTVSLGPVAFPAGAPVTQAQAGKAGVFVYRTASAGAPEEVWNEKEQSWQAPPVDLGALQPTPFSFKEGEPQPWQALVIAAGQKDKSKADRFDKAAAGFPAYRARAWIEAIDSGVKHTGSSAPSSDWTYVSEAEKARAGIIFDNSKTQPKDATLARLFVKDAGLTGAAFVEVRATGGNEVQIARCDAAGNPLATITIAGNGEIRIRPVAPAKVVIDGDLECGRIRYQPFGGGNKVDL